MHRPPEMASTPAAVWAISAGEREYTEKTPAPISMRLVTAARYPIREAAS